jgi:hypothetical protein
MRGLEPTAADGAAIIRLCRLLRPGGFMAFQAPSCASEHQGAKISSAPSRALKPGGELLGGSGARRLCGPCEGRARQLRMPVIGYLIQ